MAARIIRDIEELRGLVGQEVGVSDWFEVTQERINAFADLTLDYNWIHLDERRARAELPGGTTIAHGFLTLSLMSHLYKQAVHVQTEYKQSINYGMNRVRFVSPVPAGSRIRARCTLVAVEDLPRGLQMSWSVTVERENAEKPVLVAEWLARLY